MKRRMPEFMAAVGLAGALMAGRAEAQEKPDHENEIHSLGEKSEKTRDGFEAALEQGGEQKEREKIFLDELGLAIGDFGKYEEYSQKLREKVERAAQVTKADDEKELAKLFEQCLAYLKNAEAKNLVINLDNATLTRLYEAIPVVNYEPDGEMFGRVVSESRKYLSLLRMHVGIRTFLKRWGGEQFKEDFTVDQAKTKIREFVVGARVALGKDPGSPILYQVTKNDLLTAEDFEVLAQDAQIRTALEMHYQVNKQEVESYSKSNSKQLEDDGKVRARINAKIEKAFKKIKKQP